MFSAENLNIKTPVKLEGYHPIQFSKAVKLEIQWITKKLHQQEQQHKTNILKMKIIFIQITKSWIILINIMNKMPLSLGMKNQSRIIKVLSNQTLVKD